MNKFSSPIDIANRACQQCGIRGINTFQDNSEQAAAFGFNYDKLREAELRRNTWTFATRVTALRPISTSTMTVAPALWSAIISYGAGSVVSDANGTLWSTSTTGNVGNEPGSLTDTTWDIYFGQTTVELWSINPPGTTDGNNSYYAGELVYTTNDQGVIYVFRSVVNSNDANPGVANVWAIGTSYMRGQVASFGGWDYISLFDLNTGNEPDQTPQPWQATITYAATDQVLGINGLIYYATATTTGNDPTTDTGSHWGSFGIKGAWAPNFMASTVSSSWIRLNATLNQLNIVYPLGAGPTNQTATRNVFQLPNGFLREAPQAPKFGANSYLGAPNGLGYSDWEYQDGFIISEDGDPIVYRFIADVVQVSKFDPMFCEGLGARMGFETVERLTGATAKKSVIGAAYKQFMSDARQVNGIEDGAVEPPVDDYLTARL